MKKSIPRLTLAVLVVSMAGCQAAQEQNIRTALVKLQDAYAKQDIDGIMAVYSEDYRGQQGGQKEQLREYFEWMVFQGYFSSTRINIEDVQIEVEGDTATVAPVIYTGDWGRMDFKTVFKKEGSTWRVISGEEQYRSF
ncbi:MAG: YybH family protein [Planctomycetota bacterium]